MVDDNHAPSIAFEQAPDDRVRAVGLWDGAGPLVCPDSAALLRRALLGI